MEEVCRPRSIERSKSSCEMSSDFWKLLFDISEALVTEELAALKFLSLEHVPVRKQEDTKEPKAFFEVLKEKGMIEVGDLFFLKELLYRINRMDLLASHLGSSREEMERELQVPGMAKVSAYRQLLYGIAENLTAEDVKSVKFLLQEKLPKNKLRDNVSMLKVLVEMERNGIIKEDDLTMLKSILKAFRPDLKNKIDNYEEKTKEALKRVFKWLQFDTVEYMDLEANQIFAKIKEYSKKDHSNMDCFVCFILSHGEKNKIKGVDNELVNIKDLLSCFSGSNCPSLAGKPKLFFIQACQGYVGHPAVAVKEDCSGHLETDAIPLLSIPDQADVLVGMATVEDFECYRCIETGSVYIQCLCDKMELLCPLRKDLITILTEVNKEVGRLILNGWKQMPKITSTLRKQFIFQIPQCQSIEKQEN
ncbi:caspase-8-like isoform X3 [Lagopus muta]|uniref:caspase-8-like isoform X3 n=1 Tax=Lagopus muta TaxID=64668 RepID=UPI0020A223A5|nr:caspase-8-like isoform X3 [Lagopus muta]